MKKFAFFGLSSMAALFMSACTVGETSEGNPNQVSNYEDLPKCSSNANLIGVSYVGQKFYVEEEDAYYLCKETGWTLSDAAPVAVVNQSYIVDSTVVLGKAFVGGFFKIGSPVVLRELTVDASGKIKESGNNFNDEISSAEGEFVISNVSLRNKYALVEVSGLYNDMWTGAESEESITLRTIVDLSKDTVVEINLFSELALPRVKKLLKDGYSVSAAKIQAEHEILSSLGFGSSVEEKEAALIAATILLRNQGDVGDLSDAIQKFSESIAEDGTWKDAGSKTAYADFAYALENLKIRDEETNDVVLKTSSFRKNLESFGFKDMGGFEAYITKFWQFAYGLGSCGAARENAVIKNVDESSDSSDAYFICKSGAWATASDFERDTVGLGNVLDGTIAEGNIDNEKFYVFDSTGMGSGNPVRWLPVATAKWDDAREDGLVADSLVLEKWIGNACTDFDDVAYTVTKTTDEDDVDHFWGCSERKWVAIDEFVFNRGHVCAERYFEGDKVYKVTVDEVSRYLYCDSTIAADGKVTWAWDENKTVYDYGNGVCDGKHQNVIGKVVKDKDDANKYMRCSFSSDYFVWSMSTEANFDAQAEEDCNMGGIVTIRKKNYVCTNQVMKGKQFLYNEWRQANDDEIAADKACITATVGETVKVDSKEYKCAISQYVSGDYILVTDPEDSYYNEVLLGWYSTTDNKTKLN